MEVLVLLGFLGFPVGIFTGWLAGNEIKQGRGWLFLLKGLLFGILVAVSLFNHLGYFGIVFIPIILFFSGWLQKGIDIALILLLVLARSDLLIASLVFLYALSAESLVISNNRVFHSL